MSDDPDLTPTSQTLPVVAPELIKNAQWRTVDPRRILARAREEIENVDFLKSRFRCRKEDRNPFLSVKLKYPELGKRTGVVRFVVKIALGHLGYANSSSSRRFIRSAADEIDIDLSSGNSS